jgi:hypothetical protein
VRSWAVTFLLCVSVTAIGCGSGTNTPNSSSGLSGNWQITLLRVANPVPLTYSGFMQQTGGSVTGALILGDGCAGVGSVNGTLSGQDLQLVVNESGQDLTLTGTVASGATNALGGQFSTLSGGCTDASTGTWSAVLVKTLNGSFHGSLVSLESNGTVNVTGRLTQGPNIGASNATLSGSMVTSSVPPFCSYVTAASITGVISGTAVSSYFFAPDGSQLNSVPIEATITPDAASLTASYSFASMSKACPGDVGTLQLSFP